MYTFGTRTHETILFYTLLAFGHLISLAMFATALGLNLYTLHRPLSAETESVQLTKAYMVEMSCLLSLFYVPSPQFDANHVTMSLCKIIRSESVYSSCFALIGARQCGVLMDKC